MIYLFNPWLFKPPVVGNAVERGTRKRNNLKRRKETETVLFAQAGCAFKHCVRLILSLFTPNWSQGLEWPHLLHPPGTCGLGK